MTDEFAWPGNACVAVVASVAWETPDDNYGSRGAHERGDRGPIPADAVYPTDTWAVLERRFAELGGVQRILEVFARNEITASFYMNGRTVELFPDLTRTVQAAGHDVASQSYTHGTAIMYSRDQERERIQKTVQTFTQVFGRPPRGYAPSGGRFTPNTLALLVEAGYSWCGSYRNIDRPYIQVVNGKPIVLMNNYMLADVQSFTGKRMAPSSLTEQMKDEVDFLIEEGNAGSPKMTSYGVHPFISRGFRVKPYEEFLQYLKSRPEVWIATRSEVADHLLTNYPSLTLATQFPYSAAAATAYGFREE